MAAVSRPQKAAGLRDIITTIPLPDTVTWCAEEKTVLIIELNIPREYGMAASHEGKHLKYLS